MTGLDALERTALRYLIRKIGMHGSVCYTEGVMHDVEYGSKRERNDFTLGEQWQHNRGRNACQHRKFECGRNFYRKWKDIHVASVNVAVFEDICNTGTVPM